MKARTLIDQLQECVRELGREWLHEAAMGTRKIRRLELNIADGFDEYLLRAYQCNRDGSNPFFAIWRIGPNQINNWHIGTHFAVDQLAHAISSVTGMIADFENRHDPKTKRLRWHAPRRAR